jgi:hypothetical protein
VLNDSLIKLEKSVEVRSQQGAQGQGMGEEEGVEPQQQMGGGQGQKLRSAGQGKAWLVDSDSQWPPPPPPPQQQQQQQQQQGAAIAKTERDSCRALGQQGSPAAQ